MQLGPPGESWSLQLGPPGESRSQRVGPPVRSWSQRVGPTTSCVLAEHHAQQQHHSNHPHVGYAATTRELNHHLAQVRPPPCAACWIHHRLFFYPHQVTSCSCDALSQSGLALETLALRRRGAAGRGRGVAGIGGDGDGHRASFSGKC